MTSTPSPIEELLEKHYGLAGGPTNAEATAALLKYIDSVIGPDEPDRVIIKRLDDKTVITQTNPVNTYKYELRQSFGIER